ncbi:hypothetical protein NDU88_003152 [Pleurodeles waltl]|uniref:Uncharacterized protein n=1 Tax=Pleurodeles waltl TaxID=8319 RepID=A0AAV7VFG8_PLEWA|nr:hypothetical protein NDU88_003152 [Pleurodeles waltl]
MFVVWATWRWRSCKAREPRTPGTKHTAAAVSAAERPKQGLRTVQGERAPPVARSPPPPPAEGETRRQRRSGRGRRAPREILERLPGS